MACCGLGQPSIHSWTNPSAAFLRSAVLVGIRTIRRARRRYSQYSLSILALAEASRRIRESRRFTLRIVRFLTNLRRGDEWRRGLRLLAAYASPSRNLPGPQPSKCLKHLWSTAVAHESLDGFRYPIIDKLSIISSASATSLNRGNRNTSSTQNLTWTEHHLVLQSKVALQRLRTRD